jgi:hypothetical protein
MASNTENLNLLKKDPLTDGNETFNIQTMLNDNWDKIDEAVGNLQDEIANLDPDIPEGSISQKGIVQLSSATNSTSETLAATPKAVKAAYDLAASKLDKNPAFIELRDGAATAGPAFIDFHSGAKLTDFDSRIIAEGGNGNTGGGNLSLQANNIILNGSTTLNGWTSVKNNLDVVRDGGSGLRLIGETHAYVPIYPKGTSAGRKAYIGFGDPNSNNMQIANEYPDGDVIIWTRGLGVNVTGLYNDVQQAKQSVANGKNDIAAAIRDKGQASQGSDPFATMAAAIRNIQTLSKTANGNAYVSNSGNGTVTINVNLNIRGLGFRPRYILVSCHSYNPSTGFEYAYLNNIHQASTKVRNGGYTHSFTSTYTPLDDGFDVVVSGSITNVSSSYTTEVQINSWFAIQ